jgi:xanthine dehydrogenase accessory factor
MTPELARRLAAARAAKRPVVLATSLPDGQELIWPDDSASPALAEAASVALDRDQSGTVRLADGSSWMLAAHNPPLRLIVVGAVHAAQALVHMAVATGYTTIVIDPRRAFATTERFPGIELVHDWPDEAMDALKPDTRTAVITLTHDPKLDDPALDRALRSPAFHIGALGSRRTHARRLDRLRALGHDDAGLARIKGPVGLDIGAVTAPEIALSIMAEIVAVRRRAVERVAKAA